MNKKILLSIASITAAFNGVKALPETDSESSVNNDSNIEFKKNDLKKEFVLKINLDNWEDSQLVSHTSHRSHSSHNSHNSHSSHYSGSMI